MNIDFFNTECKENIQNNLSFGICDKQDGTKAYTDINNKKDWIAIVENKKNKNIIFTPINNCIIILKRGSNDRESTCDGMLTFENGIYLVELKEQRTGGWIPDAIGQLENSIKLLKKATNINSITYKKAYACNKRHPNFQVLDIERKRRFYKETGFRIDVQTKIKIN